MEVFGVVYLLIDGTNDLEYVGQTKQLIEKRFKQHKHGNQYIDKAIQAHGVENFVIAILKECKNKKELDFWERYFIRARNTMAPNGYNLTEGGEGIVGLEFTPEHRAKIAVSKMGEKHPQYGKPLSTEHKAKLSKAFSGEKNPQYGKPCPPERRAKISKANSGENHPFFGKRRPPETCAKISASSPRKRAVVCLETGERFESVTAAAKCYNLKPAGVSQSCKKNHAAGGYHFRYLEEYQNSQA